MRQLPRLAVGTIQRQARREPLLWGLLQALHDLDAAPLLFRSSCRPCAADVARSLTGRPTRHLDSWAMSRRAAMAALDRAAGPHELAIVEGEFDAQDEGRWSTGKSQPRMPGTPPASSLDTLCDWLDLPRIAVIDVSQLSACVLPRLHQRLDGVLLDRVADERSVAYWKTTLPALVGAPVLGWLEENAPLRALCTLLPTGACPSSDLCTALAAKLLPSLDVEALARLSCRASALPDELDGFTWHSDRRRFRIAVANDEAYHGYYPETLELLEAAGAELCDFSPLASGAIPAGVDVVYFGCGHPERHAAQLAGNHCLKQSLRCFAAAGGRIYAEGSGLAYLCREIVFPCGNTVPMSGLLPATARWLPHASQPEPTEVTFGATSWLVPSRTVLRGYRHPGWQIEPRGPMITYAAGARQRLDVLGRGNVIGSQVLFNLAANRHLLRPFFEPYATVSASVHDE